MKVRVSRTPEWNVLMSRSFSSNALMLFNFAKFLLKSIVSNEFQRHINRLYEYSSTRSGSRGETRGQWEHNSPGSESLWGRRMTAGGDEKSNQCHKYFLQYSTFASERFQART